MDALLRDLRLACRTLLRTPAFTATAVAALALGIGANTAIFSVVDAVLLKPLPYAQPDRLVLFMNTSPQGSGPMASPAKFNVWREQGRALQDISAYHFNVVNLTSGADPEQVPAGEVSAGFFRLFGAPLVAGRTFSANEDRPGGGHVVVLGDGFWRRRFGGDRSVIGRAIPINGDPYVVIGVLGPFDTEAIRFSGAPPDVWLPFQLDPTSTMQGNYFLAAGRLKPGITAGMADARLKLAADEFRRTFPGALGPQGSFGVEPLQDVMVRSVRSSLLVLTGAVGFVLLIACANVANLLLVRATARQREMAVRAALGAGRGRIVRQLLTESLVLAAAGGVLGLAIGTAGIRALVALSPGTIPRVGPEGAAIGLDWRVVAFTALVSVATGIVFGLLPALHAARTNLVASLKEGSGRTGGGARQNRTRAFFVVSEMALALVLLVGAALLIRTFAALRAVNPGFDSRNVLTMSMSLLGPRFAKSSTVGDIMRTGVERLQAVPGVEAAAAGCCVPLRGGFGLPFVIEGRPLEGRFHGGGEFTPISPTYFGTFRIPIVRGRAFTDRDAAGAPDVVIINETMARRYWPTGDPLADRLTIAKGMGPQLGQLPRQIVGVAADVRDAALSLDPQPTMYVPWAQLPDAQNANLLGITPLAWFVRTRGDPHAALGPVQDVLRQVSGGLPVAGVRTMDEVVGDSTARSDFNMLLLTIFAGTALLLAAIGIYGLMAYSVEQRTQEIGVRVALGADAGQVRHMIVAQGMRVAVAGIVVGLAGAFALTRLIAGLLYGVTARDPVVFVATPVLLAIVALAGVWLPARRAARVHPATALRAE